MNVKFSIPAKQHAGACAAKDSARYCITSTLAYSSADGQLYLAATDGRCLSVLPVESSGALPKPTLLPSDALKAPSSKPAEIIVNGEVRVTKGKTQSVHKLPGQEGLFPPIGQVVPDERPYRAITFDATLLARIASAVSSDGMVTIFIPDKIGDSGAGVPVVGHKSDVHGLPDGHIGIGVLHALHVKSEEIHKTRTFYRKHADAVPKQSLKFTPEPTPPAEKS